MANMNMSFDRETLRELADEGNETALDRLADMADAAGDLGELSELLDEGCMRAGSLLTRRAAAAATSGSCNGSPTPGTTRRGTSWIGC